MTGTGCFDRPRGRFWSVGQKLIATIGLAVCLGIGAMILFHARQQQAEILTANERTMRQVAEAAQRGLETIMLGGYADVAPYYTERLKELRNIEDFRILRLDGREAFLDNDTITAINERFGTEIFPLKPADKQVQVVAADSPELRDAVAGRRPVTSYGTDSLGRSEITLLSPIILDDRCFACHGDGQPVKGVIKLTTSLAAVEAEIRDTWHQALLILLVAVSLIAAAAWIVVRRSILRPIERVSAAMARIAAGELDQSVPVPSQDELGQMAVSFNRMVDQLLRTYEGLQTEQNKLTTIILAAIEGIVVTDEGGSVVLVNPAAERLLGKPAVQIVGEGFPALLDDPERMTEWLRGGSACEDTAYRGRILNVRIARIADGTGDAVGSAALLRDVTEERRLEHRLRSQSTTDALTGLWNRRHLDQTLAAEFERARRYGLDLAVLMFDIDHFKQFNDSYGHDQGDRVLKAVAGAVIAVIRQVDIPCRYGGEEFVVVLPSTDIGSALVIAERLRAKVAETAVDGLQVTVTVGTAALRGSGTSEPAQLLDAADKALYQGKNAGRNRVIAARPAVPDMVEC